MIFLTVCLIILRLSFWRLFPQYGTTIVGDVVFGLICFTVLTLVQLFKMSSPLAPGVLFLVFATSLSFFNTTSFFQSLAGWFLLLVYASSFCLLIKYVRTREHIRLIWLSLYCGAIVSAGLGIYEFVKLQTATPPDGIPSALNLIYTTKRACSFQGWPTAFAGHLILFIPTAVVFFLENKNFLRCGIVLLFLAGLGSSLTFLAPLSLGLTFLLTNNQKRVKWVLVSLFLLLAIVGDSKSLSAFLTARGEYYQTAWTMITRHPFVGAGISTFKSVGRSPSAFAHNSYLQIWAETGPIGLIGILLVTYTFWTMRPAKDSLMIAMYIGLLAFFIDNIFSFTMIKPNLSFVWWVALALYSNLQQRRAK